MKYSKSELLDMYERMVRGRIFAYKMKEAVAAGNIRISFHSPLGQEAVGVGIAAAMRPTDWFVATHRSQNTTMQRLGLYEYICELFCKRDGACRGVTFDYHLCNLEKRMPVPVATLGADYPIYTGFAWGLKNQGIDEIVVVEAGDGACSEGATYEAWGMAALYKVPCVYVIVNNEWGMSSQLKDQSFNPNVSEKAIPIGLPTQIADGNDVLAVREVMEKAIEMARKNEPNVVELKTLRWSDHFVGQRAYERPDQAKLDDAMVNDDPIKRFEEYLLKNNVADSKYFSEKRAMLEAELDDVIARAAAAPVAEYDDVFNKNLVYASPETGGDL